MRLRRAFGYFRACMDRTPAVEQAAEAETAWDWWQGSSPGRAVDKRPTSGSGQVTQDLDTRSRFALTALCDVISRGRTFELQLSTGISGRLSLVQSKTWCAFLDYVNTKKLDRIHQTAL